MTEDDRDSDDISRAKLAGGIAVVKWLLGGALLAGIAATATFGGLIVRMDERQRVLEERLVEVRAESRQLGDAVEGITIWRERADAAHQRLTDRVAGNDERLKKLEQRRR